MRRAASAGPAGFDPEVDRRHTARLREIVRDIGWPTRSRVGEEAEHMAWLLVQHADRDRAFQRECLVLMSKEPANEVCRAHLAYLEDRLAVAEGRPQRYGTQFVEGGPAPIDDPDQLDARRAASGLSPFAEYAERMANLARSQRRPG
jgi:hypothetical protein